MHQIQIPFALFSRGPLLDGSGNLGLSKEEQSAILRFLNQTGTSSVLLGKRALEDQDALRLEEALKSILEELPTEPHSILGIYHQEMQNMLLPLKGNAFLKGFIKMLNAEAFYGAFISSLCNFGDCSIEKCDLAYQRTISILRSPHSKNLAPTRFSWIIGQARKEWSRISRIVGGHKYCGCHSVDQSHSQWPKDRQCLTVIDQIAAHPDKRFALVGCDWGGGHKSAVRAAGNIIAEKLNGEVYTIDLPNHVLPPSQDRVRNSILGKIGVCNSVSEFTNTLARHKAVALTNFLRGAPSAPDPTLGGEQLPFVLRRFLELQPDFVLTSYNMHNESIITAAKILKIPCLHIPTDIRDPINTRGKPRDYTYFKMGFPINEALDLRVSRVTQQQSVILGLPVRSELLNRIKGLEELAQLKGKWNVPLDKRVVLIMGGENGVPSSVPSLLSTLYKNKDPNIQVFVLCGRNEVTRGRIASLKIPFLRALGFQEVANMRELYAMASLGGLLISKSGGGTVAEALHMGVPLMIDAMPTPILGFGFKHMIFGILNWAAEKAGAARELPWERANGSFMIEKGMASRFHDDKEFRNQFGIWIKRDLKKIYEYEGPDFSETLPKTVLEMLG